jgi:hypothetical protein
MTSQPKPGGCAERCLLELEPGSVLVLKFQPQPALWRSACGGGSSSFAAPSSSFATTWATAAIPARVSLSLGRSGPRNAAGGIPRPAATFPRLEASCQHTSGTLPSRPAAESPPHPVVRRSAADGSVHPFVGQRVAPSDVSPEAGGRTISPTGTPETNCSGSSCRPRASLRNVSA